MSEFANDAATAARARAAARALIGLGDKIAAEQDGGLAVEAVHAAVAPGAWSWWRLITDSARIILDCEERGYGAVVAPVMRNLINHTLALQWLVDGGETALKALDDYSDEQLLQLVEAASANNWTIDEPTAKALRTAIAERAAAPDPAVTKLSKEIGSPWRLMKAYGVPDLYVLYRLLCAYSHTTRATAQAYQHLDGDHDPELRETPVDLGDGNVIWTAVCLIQAGRVMDTVLAGQPLTAALEEATTSLGLPEAILPGRITAASGR
jgi:hypothetical protein